MVKFRFLLLSSEGDKEDGAAVSGDVIVGSIFFGLFNGYRVFLTCLEGFIQVFRMFQDVVFMIQLTI
jgi:hypothetical protein